LELLLDSLLFFPKKAKNAEAISQSQQENCERDTLLTQVQAQMPFEYCFIQMANEAYSLSLNIYYFLRNNFDFKYILKILIFMVYN